jgi:predicted nucleic acid-binding protein
LNTYADSSFLVASYIVDAHSHVVDQRLAAAPSVWLTPFNRAELANAIFQQVFLKRLSLAQAQSAWSDFERDYQHGLWMQVEFPPRAWETSIDLSRRHGATFGVRTLDSLHVACALELKAQKFWTFDDRQARLAEAVGLDTKV